MATPSDSSEEPCSICGAPSDDHEGLNHEFNLHNQLIPKARPTPRQSNRPTPVMVGAIDMDLRRILFQKGIISNEDFASLYDPGAGASGDRETGEAPSSG